MTEPRAWRISKINRISPKGICHITLAQDHYDPVRDYVETNSSGNVIGLWADYYDSPVTPVTPTPTTSGINVKITYSSNSPKIKIGGSAKTFTVHFYDGESETQIQPGAWQFKIDNVDVSSLITQQITGASNKIKFNGNDDYIGKVLNIKYTTTDNQYSGEIDAPLIAL